MIWITALVRPKNPRPLAVDSPTQAILFLTEGSKTGSKLTEGFYIRYILSVTNDDCDLIFPKQMSSLML